MTEPNPSQVHHATIDVERRYEHPVAAVWQAWADPDARKRWQPTPDGMRMVFENETFVVGEVQKSRMLQGDQVMASFEERYIDIVDRERILFSVFVEAGGQIMSHSQNTIQFVPEGNATRLLCTEQVAWLMGKSMRADHEGGWAMLLDRLGNVLDQP